MSNIFDKDALMESIDGDTEFLQETVTMLQEDVPVLLDEIQSAVASQDTAHLAKAAHALKGMLANFYAEPATAAARELESMGREGRLEDVESAKARVLHETQRLQEALKVFLDGGSD